MSLSFKFIPLTFLSDENEIKKQIRNTIILKYFFERNSETVHLEDLITGTQYGYNASALVQGRNKFLRISDITDGKVNWETVPYCNCTDEETYLLFPNDILIARTGGTTGKSFLISEPPALSIYAGYLIRIRANDATNPNYLNLFLNSYVYWSQIVSLNEDNFRPSVNANKLKKLVLPKCDKKIQNDAVKISNGEYVKGYEDLYLLIEEIVSKYDKIKVIQFERKNQLEFHKQLKQLFIQEAFEGKFSLKWRKENSKIESAFQLLEKIKNEKTDKLKKSRKNNNSKSISKGDFPYEIPDTWLWCYIAEIAEISTGDSINKDVKDSKYKNNSQGLDYIGTKDVEFNGKGVYYNNGVKIPFLDSQFKVAKKHSTLICIEGGSSGKKIGLIDRDVCYGNKLLATTFTDIINPFFYHYFFYSKIFEKEFKMKSKGLRGGVALNEFKSIRIPLVPIEEQNFLANRIKEVLISCDELEDELIKSEINTRALIQAVLKDAFEIKTNTLDSLFEDINYNLYVAMIHKQIENRLRINYGEVATQKTVFNINAFTDQKIPYNFINSNHGTFSPQLKEDLSKNTYLTKDKKGSGEVFIINPSKENEVLNALSNPKNKQFVRAVNEVLDIYELPFINKETDKIELLNTVAKLIIDTKSTDIEIIYAGMQKWEIKQNSFNTKAEKFSKTDTKKMIELIKNLGLVSKLLKN